MSFLLSFPSCENQFFLGHRGWCEFANPEDWRDHVARQFLRLSGFSEAAKHNVVEAGRDHVLRHVAPEAEDLARAGALAPSSQLVQQAVEAADQCRDFARRVYRGEVPAALWCGALEVEDRSAISEQVRAALATQEPRWAVEALEEAALLCTILSKDSWARDVEVQHLLRRVTLLTHENRVLRKKQEGGPWDPDTALVSRSHAHDAVHLLCDAAAVVVRQALGDFDMDASKEGKDDISV